MKLHYNVRNSDASFLAASLAWRRDVAERSWGQIFQHLFIFVSAKEFVLADTSPSEVALVDEDVLTRARLKTPPCIALQASRAARLTTISFKVGTFALSMSVEVGMWSFRV